MFPLHNANSEGLGQSVFHSPLVYCEPKKASVSIHNWHNWSILSLKYIFHQKYLVTMIPRHTYIIILNIGTDKSEQTV